MNADEIKALREAVAKVYPDVQLAFHKKDSYVDRKEDMFYVHKGDSILGFINVKDATPYLILTAIKWHTYAYALAEERTKAAFIGKLCETFNLQEADDEN